MRLGPPSRQAGAGHAGTSWVQGPLGSDPALPLCLRSVQLIWGQWATQPLPHPTPYPPTSGIPKPSPPCLMELKETEATCHNPREPD